MKAHYRGRKEILAALDVIDWRTARKLAEREHDPLNLRWDAFDRPWLDGAELESWMTRNDRAHRFRRIELRIQRDPELLAKLGDLLPGAPVGQSCTPVPQRRKTD